MQVSNIPRAVIRSNVANHPNFGLRFNLRIKTEYFTKIDNRSALPGTLLHLRKVYTLGRGVRIGGQPIQSPAGPTYLAALFIPG